jgi:hypothetical protein
VQREIFHLYTEAEVFESVRGLTRSEKKWRRNGEAQLFEGLVQEKKASLTVSGGREALDVFLSLNSFILEG